MAGFRMRRGRRKADHGAKGSAERPDEGSADGSAAGFASDRRSRAGDSSQGFAIAPAPLIDFLPQSVHVETQLRRDRPLKGLAVVAALLLFAVGSWMHHRQSNELRMQRDDLRTQKASSLDPSAAADLRAERDRLDERADLIATFVPTAATSRLALVVFESLPPESHLTRLSIRQTQRLTNTGQAASDEATPPDGASGWVLDRFRRTQAKRRETIELTVEGIVRDDAALGRLLASLDRSHAFDAIRIEMSEPATLRGLPRRRFQMSLRRKPTRAVAAASPNPDPSRR